MKAKVSLDDESGGLNRQLVLLPLNPSSVSQFQPFMEEFQLPVRYQVLRQRSYATVSSPVHMTKEQPAVELHTLRHMCLMFFSYPS